MTSEERRLELERRRMKALLDPLAAGVDAAGFRSGDPAGIVGEFSASRNSMSQADVEIAALLVAMISWGNRKAIRATARKLVFEEMESRPERYIRNGLFENGGRGAFGKCVYRTLDFPHFQAVCRNLGSALRGKSTLEGALSGKSAVDALRELCSILAPAKVGFPGSSPCKRMCMFMRWMTRPGAPDFGLWKTRSQADLLAVMDVHVNRQTQAMRRCKTPSWKGCLELTGIFKAWDPCDPLKYDIALMMLADGQRPAAPARPQNAS